MGQYYMTYTEDKKGNVKVYNRTVDDVYTPAKLTEHSWWFNPFVNTICYKIHHKPTKVAWVGDYSDEINPDIYKVVWGEKTNTLPVTEAQVILFGKFLVNHSKKLFMSCDKYHNNCNKNNWCLHPLPLLTAIGNGHGCGDYRGINEDKVGCWALDYISVEENVPKGYTEFKIEFKEEE